VNYPNLQKSCIILKEYVTASLPSNSGCNAQDLYSEASVTAETNWLENNILSPFFFFFKCSLCAIKPG